MKKSAYSLTITAVTCFMLASQPVLAQVGGGWSASGATATGKDTGKKFKDGKTSPHDGHDMGSDRIDGNTQSAAGNTPAPGASPSKEQTGLNADTKRSAKKPGKAKKGSSSGTTGGADRWVFFGKLKERKTPQSGPKRGETHLAALRMLWGAWP